MSKIQIKKIIAHDLDLKEEYPEMHKQIMNLTHVPKDALDFFSDHITSSLIAKQIKACTFIDRNFYILTDCQNISMNLKDDQLFIESSILMSRNLFNVMKATSTKSSGTLIFIVYIDLESGIHYLAIMKMDPNKAIQIDRTNNKFIVQKDILQSVNEKLHKCAFIKLVADLWNEEVHLRVLDKQQMTGEVSKYFLNTFLRARPVVNDKVMTELVNTQLVEFAFAENIINSQEEIINFSTKVDKVLRSGAEIDLDRDLDSLFKTLVPGDADRENKINSFKQKLLRKHENAVFQFTAEKKPTVAILSHKESDIKVQFSLQDKDTKVFLKYIDEADGSITTVISFKGVELKEKFK